jgi:hypothetical protein
MRTLFIAAVARSSTARKPPERRVSRWRRSSCSRLTLKVPSVSNMTAALSQPPNLVVECAVGVIDVKVK